MLFNPNWHTNDKLEIERFLKIIENATPVDNPPEVPQVSTSFNFSILTPHETIEKRNFSINGTALDEILEDGTIKYYVLDKDSQDAEFLYELCKGYWN